LAACLSGWAMELHLVRAGRVIFKAVVALNRQLPGTDVQDDISKAAAIVLISERHKSFEVFLQMRGVVFDGFVLAPRIPFAVETLHFLGGTIVAVSIKMSRDEGHACFCELVAFGEYGSFGGLLLRDQGCVTTTCIVFHLCFSADLVLFAHRLSCLHSADDQMSKAANSASSSAARCVELQRCMCSQAPRSILNFGGLEQVGKQHQQLPRSFFFNRCNPEA